jgi:hypothetical protein
MIKYEYHFGHRFRTGNFDLYVNKVDTETGKVLDTHLLFRTWNKPPSQEDGEFVFDDDDVERDGYNLYKYKMDQRNDSLILRHIIRLPFTKGKKWIKTGVE